MKKRDAIYYRKREQAELERAVQAPDNAARRAHLGLADLYRRALQRLELVEEEGGSYPKKKGQPKLTLKF